MTLTVGSFTLGGQWADSHSSDASATAPPGMPQTWQISPDVQVSTLRPGIWIHTSWHTYPDGSRVSSNGLVVQEEDRLLLIDTAWGEQSTEHLLQWISRELRHPVTRAIVTHAHEDRMGGASVLVRRGISFVAHPQTRTLARSRGWPEPDSVGDLSIGEATGLGSVEVFYPGAAHAPDNIVVWIPEGRVLFGGCAVKAADARTLGDTRDADLAAWREALLRVEQRYRLAATVVPGHGAVGGPELLRHTAELLAQRK